MPNRLIKIRYEALVHDAFRHAMPADDPRPLATSVVVNDVTDGTWGANSHVMHLADFARLVGFEHLHDPLTQTANGS